VSADNPTGILALVNAYDEVDCHEDEATVLERYASAQERNCFSTGSCLPGTSVTGFEGSRKLEGTRGGPGVSTPDPWDGFSRSEEAFSKIKVALRKAQPRTREALIEALGTPYVADRRISQ
jgi:hypothetical protein